MNRYVILEGNPIDGFTVHGPFDDRDEAALWAEARLGLDWWITSIEPNIEEFSA